MVVCPHGKQFTIRAESQEGDFPCDVLQGIQERSVGDTAQFQGAFRGDDRANLAVRGAAGPEKVVASVLRFESRAVRDAPELPAESQRLDRKRRAIRREGQTVRPDLIPLLVYAARGGELATAE